MPVFVDTNVFVYERDATEKSKQKRARDWIAHLWDSRQGRISYQILREFYVTVVYKLKPGVEASEARAIVRELSVWEPIPTRLDLLERAWSLGDRYSLSWWDSLVVAAAQVSECHVLLTEDLQHGQEIGPLRILNPFEFPDMDPVEILRALEEDRWPP